MVEARISEERNSGRPDVWMVVVYDEVKVDAPTTATPSAAITAHQPQATSSDAITSASTLIK